MLNPTRHQVVLAGQVKNALTGEALSGAIVKLIQAPEALIRLTLFKAKLFGLPVAVAQQPCLTTFFQPSSQTLPASLDHLQKILTKAQIKISDLLDCFQEILENPAICSQDQFQALQIISDYFPIPSKSRDRQPIRVKTTPDGWFYFTNLPIGFYRLAAYLPNQGLRYSTVYQEIMLGSEPHNPDDPLQVNIELKPTTLLGKITNSHDQEAICMARVQLQYSGESTFSLGEIDPHQSPAWNYRFIGLEPRGSPITVMVSAKGYAAQQQQIHLQIGEVQSLNFQLVSQ